MIEIKISDNNCVNIEILTFIKIDLVPSQLNNNHAERIKDLYPENDISIITFLLNSLELTEHNLKFADIGSFW